MGKRFVRLTVASVLLAAVAFVCGVWYGVRYLKCISVAGESSDSILSLSKKQQTSSAKSAKTKISSSAKPIFLLESSINSDGMMILDFLADADLRHDTLQLFVTPNVKNITAKVYKKRVIVSGEFKPGTVYHVKVAAGLRDNAGGVLEGTAETQLRAGDLAPLLQFIAEGKYFPLHSKDWRIPFKTRNLKNVNISLYKLYSDNVMYFHGNDLDYSRQFRELILSKNIEIQSEKNIEKIHTVDLSKLISVSSPGFYELHVQNDQCTSYDVRVCRIIITDLAPTVVTDAEHGKAVVRVASLKDDKPIAGARVQVLSYQNRIAASGNTDPNGIAVLKVDPKWNSNEDSFFAVQVTKGKDITYFKLSNTYCNACYGLYKGEAKPCQIMVFAERGVCRPGEKFQIYAIGRRNPDNKPLSNTEITLKIYQPDGRVIAEKRLKSDRNGMASCDFVLATEAGDGRYRIECFHNSSKVCCGSGDILVTDYVPDRIKVTAKGESGTIINTDSVWNAEFQADYYFGMPVAQGVWNSSCFSALASQPEHWKKWTVGDCSLFDGGRVSNDNGHMEQDGVISVEYPGFKAVGGKAFNPVEIFAEVTVNEPGGRGVVGRTSHLMLPSEYFIGLRYGAHKSAPLEYTLLSYCQDAKSNAVNDVDIVFEFCRLNWEYVVVKSSNGTFKREWQLEKTPCNNLNRKISRKKFILGEIERLPLNLADGHYQVTAKIGDKVLTTLEFYHYSGESDGRFSDPQQLHFKYNAVSYNPGETAVISVTVPSAGTMMLNGGEKHLEFTKVVPMRAGKNTFEVKIPKNIGTMGYTIVSTVVMPTGDNLMRRCFGMLRLPVSQKKHQSTLEFTMPDVAEPGSMVEMQLKTIDYANKPLSGSVMIYGVDAGVLALTKYEQPDIYNFFYKGQMTSWGCYDVYGDIYPSLALIREQIFGGGDLINFLGKIKRENCVRVILPIIRVPESGIVKKTVKLPQFSGEMKWFAVFAGEDSVGVAQRNMKLRNRYTLTLQGADFLAPGDEYELTIGIFNHASEKGQYKIRLDVPPQLKSSVAKSALLFSGTVNKGEQKYEKIRLRAAGQIGCGQIVLSAEMDNLKQKQHFDVTVRSVNAYQTKTDNVVVKPGQSIEYKVNSGDFYGKVTNRYFWSGNIIGEVSEALDWLNKYPYGCLEQTAAGGFPFLVAESLAKAGVLSKDSGNTARRKIALIYRSLCSMALSNGSFAMWPGGIESWQAGSLFALHFIFEAERAGELVIDPIDKRAYCSYLKTIFNDLRPENRFNYAYAALVLAIAGDQGFAAPARSIIGECSKNDFPVFLAGIACIRGGFSASGAAAIKRVPIKEFFKQDPANELWFSPVEKLGMSLYLLSKCDIDAENIKKKIAFELLKMRRNDGTAWGSTQANSWAICGLAAYAGNKAAVPAKVQLTIDGKKISANSMVCENGTFNHELILHNQSNNAVFMSCRTSGIPKKNEIGSHGVIKISRRYLDKNNKPVKLAKHGDLLTVEVAFETPKYEKNVVLSDLLPAGLALEDSRLTTRSANLVKPVDTKEKMWHPEHLERRADRIIAVGSLDAGKHIFTYQVRAAVKGKFSVPGVSMEGMYNPDFCGRFVPGCLFEVK